MQARKVYMGEARQCPNTEYYTVIMAKQDTIAEAGSYWVPRVPKRGVWTGMKATVTQPPASVARVILRTGESPLPPDSHPLVPTPQPLYLAETFCSSFYSSSPGAMPGPFSPDPISLPSPSVVQRLPPQPSTPAPCKSDERCE